MRVAVADIQFEARHRTATKTEEHASLRMSGRTAATGSRGVRVEEGRTADRVGISEQAHAQHATVRDALTNAANRCAELVDAVETNRDEEDASEDAKLRLFRLVIEAVTGSKIRPMKVDQDGATEGVQAEEPNPAGEPLTPSLEEPSGSFGLAYDYTRQYHESEQTSVAAKGVVATADGKQIEFAVHVEMQRAYHHTLNESVRLGDAARQKDPLFLFFDGEVGQLPEGGFSFDLDADGSPENIHFVGPSNAALALDRDGNGKVDDGSELFGVESGDGFADLARHDADSNGWIDQADPIFRELRLWSLSKDGQSRLDTLSERGVGAIYLGHVSSPYQIKDASNRLQGVVRATGVWLGENKTVGVAQQIDLAV